MTEKDASPGLITYQRYLLGRFPWRPALAVSLHLRDSRRYHWVILAPFLERGTILMTEELWHNF